jgi:myo-inositol 2-dehydrogenase/D-chiro-inositol 1-dehydrogenase
VVRVGVLGAGRIGKVHAEHLAHRVAGARLVAVCDVQPGAAEACAARFGAKAFTDPAAVLEDPNVDAVIICTSTDTHARFIEEAARAKKHVFCEKPIDHDLSRIDRALLAAKSAGVKLQIGFNRRFDPNFRHVRETVAAGKIGKPLLVRITSRDPRPPPIEYVKVSGGMFLDMTIHDFDMARYLAGANVTSVFAVGGARVDPKIGAAGDIDTAIVTLEFENGAFGTIDNCREAVYGYDQRVEVFGSGGVAWADNQTPHRTGRGDREGMHAPLPLDFFMDRYTESFIAEMSAFVACIRDGGEPPVTGEDGRVPVVMALAANKSLKEKRPVALAEVTRG